jgi:hypothetical protein
MANGWQVIKEARAAMGSSRKRLGRNGKIRYNACYRDLRGTVLSAGTFATEKASDRAWQKAEVELRQGRVGDPARGRQRFRKYVEERWLPHHVLEPTSREKYTYYLGAFIYPALGKMPMAEILHPPPVGQLPAERAHLHRHNRMGERAASHGRHIPAHSAGSPEPAQHNPG